MSFFLKQPNSKNETLIYFLSRINRKQFKYSTGLKVEPKNWDANSKRLLKTAKFYSARNQTLTNIESEFNAILWEFKKESQSPDFDIIKNRLDAICGKSPRFTEKSLTADFNDFEEIWINEWIESLKYSSVKSTIDKKRYTLNCLTEFSEKTGYPLSFENINDNFAKRFKKWALTQVTNTGALRFKRDNSINKYISITKEFVKWANKYGITTTQNYKSISNCNEDYFTPFALENEDILKIANIDLNEIDLTEYGIRPCNIQKIRNALSKTRDAFLFRCFCGIRFSDYLKLTKDKIQNNRMTLVTQKTSVSISLPLSKLAIEILSRNNFIPPKLNNQNENENLKLLCRIAGFNENVTVTYKRGGSKQEVMKERWELVTTHTARKTFITNCLRAGIEPYLVMEMVGIKKETTFKRYIQVSNKDMIEAIHRLELYVGKKKP